MLTDNAKTVTVEHVAGVAVRHPEIVAAGRHYGSTVLSCVPFDPESKGGVEATVKIAKADLVPTSANLAEAYSSFADLAADCEAWCQRVDARAHRETGAAPVDRLPAEQGHLHVLPVEPHAAALGEDRRVDDDQTIRFGSVRYSTPPAHVGERVWCRVVGDELAVVGATSAGLAEIARHRLSVLAGADRAAGCRRRAQRRDLRAARGLAADGDQLARPLPRRRDRRVGRPAPLGAPTHSRSPRDRGRHPEVPAGQARGHALVEPAARPPAANRGRDGGPGVAGARHRALALGDLQVLHRPGTGREGHRRRRALPGPTRERCGALRRREVPDSGPQPHRADAPDAARPARAAHPRLPPPWHHHPVRGLGDRHRPRDRALSTAASSPGVPAVPTPDRPRLPRGRAAPGDGQLRRPQAPRRPGMARGEPAGERPLHPNLGVLAEPGQVLVLDHRAPSHPPRQLRLSVRPQPPHPRLLDGWNDRAHPFTWTKTAEQILAKADRKKTSDAAH